MTTTKPSANWTRFRASSSEIRRVSGTPMPAASGEQTPAAVAERLWTVAEVADHLGVTRHSVYNWSTVAGLPPCESARGGFASATPTSNAFSPRQRLPRSPAPAGTMSSRILSRPAGPDISTAIKARGTVSPDGRDRPAHAVRSGPPPRDSPADAAVQLATETRGLARALHAIADAVEHLRRVLEQDAD